MRFRWYSVPEPRKSQVSFILQSIGSRDMQGWASSFSGGVVEEQERKRSKERERERKRWRNPSGRLDGRRDGGGTAVN